MKGLPRDLLGVGVGVALVVLFLRLPLGSPLVDRAVDDLAQLTAAGAAAGCCWWRARRSAGAARLAWLLMAAATGSWAAGEAVWTWYEVIVQRATPFPSLADVGFLLFPLLAGVGLLVWPSDALRGAARWRSLLDGVLVAGSLFLLSWTTALGSIIRDGSDGLVAYVVSMAYPAADLVLLTMTVVVLARARYAVRSGLHVLSLGLALLCVADSGFAYLNATDRYQTGSLVDAGWMGGFSLVALAALRAADAPVATGAAGSPSAAVVEARGRSLLPYVPAGAGLLAGLATGLSGRGSTVTLVAAAVVITALLARQLLALLDNRRLVAQVLTAQEALRHQAFHDSLTGLANRSLFTDRLHHGVELHRRDLRSISLLYCDLDGFKHVNDTFGHGAGDVVIKAAAERLQAVTRTGDTVARLGGDEFAILLEDGGDAATVAGRILDGFARPVVLDGHVVPVGVSIGIATLDPAHAAVTAGELLRRADAAMYAAKRAGKNTASTWRPSPAPAALAAAAAAAPMPVSPVDRGGVHGS